MSENFEFKPSKKSKVSSSKSQRQLRVGEELRHLISNVLLRETFYDQIQSMLKDKSHKIISVVPLESSKHNRRRHLVLMSAQTERTRNVRNKRYIFFKESNIK